MTARNILYVTQPTSPVADVVGSGLTHVILGSCHIEQNPAMQKLRILSGSTSITTLFSSTQFSGWIAGLNAGRLPDELRAVIEPVFLALGVVLYGSTVTVNTPGSSWTLNVPAGQSYPMQVDEKGTFISYNGAPLTIITDKTTYLQYQKQLDQGVFPAGLQQSAKLSGPNSNYTVMQLPAQITGQPQWLITDTTNGFVWYTGIGSNQGPDTMAVHNYQDFFTPNLQSFVDAVGQVVDSGVPVLVSLGGWGDATTWQIMGQDTQQALIVVAELLGLLGAAGVDYDFETGDPGSATTAMTTFTQDLQAALPNTIVTICPYSSTIGTLVNVWGNVGLDAISWANCQNYDPANNPPSDVTSTFLTPIADKFPQLQKSAANAAPYVVIGFTAQGYTAEQFAACISDVVLGPPAYPNLGGAFTYDMENLPASARTPAGLKAWASTVAGALAGKKASAKCPCASAD